ncbi:MAG: class I SAM-dependent methyltransferase [Pirellulales bacterium]|nr:class I SAM-dependent methyltransferase [Pirellulales bacterium]
MSSTKVDVAELGEIQETLLITLWARAAESQEPQPILRDPRATEIVRQIDYDFDRFRRETKLTQPTACVRATVFDRWVRQFMEEHPDGAIIEIGAGLDTRFERLDNGRIRWFDLDMPDSMSVRRRFFQETDRRRFITSSVLDPSWLEQVKACGAEHYFIISEGVLLYFSEAQVKQVLGLLADAFPGACFAFDSCARWAQENSRKLEAVKITNAEFRWGIDDIHEIEAWDPRYRVLEADTTMNYHRQRYPWPIRFFTYWFPKTRMLFSINLVRLGG